MSIKKTICLNMIVKNEMDIIIDTLNNLCSYITFDYWVISDTGSTDKTKELIIDFFKNKNIPGELVEHNWVDFSYNRNKALECAFNKTDYLLIFDADDRVMGDFKLIDLIKDQYFIKIGSKDFLYERILLVTNRKKWKFKGVIHEYICGDDISDLTSDTIEGDYYIESGRFGNRSKNPNKYLDDAIILKNAFNNDDDMKCRYAFYCAQSYKDAGVLYSDESIKWYKKVLELNNWEQEKYYACIMIGNHYNNIKDNDMAIRYWLKSSSYDNERIEGIVNAMECMRNNDEHLMVNLLYHKYKCYNKNNFHNKLFVDRSKYNDMLEYNNSISAYYVKGEEESGYECCKKIIKNNIIEDELMKITLKNINFYKQYNDLSVPTSFHKKECKDSKNILFYTGYSNINWNYSYIINNSLGGSEKAVAYLAKYLPKDYNIYISGDVTNELVDNITYININQLQELINTIQFHTIICSRYIAFFEMFKNISFYQFYIWAHDCELLPYGNNINYNNKLKHTELISKWHKNIDGCICQTSWHAIEYYKLYPELKDKIKIINNGIDTILFTPMIQVKYEPTHIISLYNYKKKNKFIYTSCAERGLITLLKLWSNIVEHLPDATLVISSYNNFNSTDLKDFSIIKDIMEKYPQSIRHVGKLNSKQLYQEMSSAEYWLYPTFIKETSCITAMEMLASGVICIYYPLGGLVDTMKGYGIPVDNENDIIKTLISLSNEMDQAIILKKTELRKNGINYAMIDCSWEKRADEWSKLLLL